MFSRPLIRSPDCGHSWTMFSADISYCAFPNFSTSPDSYTSRIRLAISSLFIAVPPALRLSTSVLRGRTLSKLAEMARISELLAAGRTVSFEFFPPKDNEEQALLTRTIADLQPLKPSFVSVTYRGGRISRERTTRVVIDLLRTTDLTPMPHLTCVAHPRFELGEIIGGFRAAGLENLLPPRGGPLPEGGAFKEVAHASELGGVRRPLGV